jgi:hypothetical protein
MTKVTTLFTPIVATVTPNGGTLTPGDSIVIDTNVPAVVYYTIDGSEPRAGSFGTKKGDAPITLELRVPTRLRFKAFDSRPGRATNQTKTLEATFDIARSNPLEVYRDTNHFFKKITKAIVDQNFYLTEGKWLVPTSSSPFTYLFVNREPYSIFLRVLHNGVDVYPGLNPPLVGAGQSKEVPLRPQSGENRIEIQTNRAGFTALYDSGRYDIDTYD